MATLQSFVCGSKIGLPLMFLAMILVLPLTRSAPLEEAKLLRQIADQYSAPLVVSFLHSRIQKNEEMISKIESSLKDLDQSKVDVFDLAEKTLELLDEQLTALEKADYFDFNGTEKVKYFIEQFIMQNEMYPIEFGSYGAVKVPVTPDALLENLGKKTSKVMISSTNTMIQTYLTDIDEKERSFGSNRMQKLAAFLAKRELKLLSNYQYPPSYGNDGYNEANDPKFALGTVLRKVKRIVDFFYAQFNYLADSKSTNRMGEKSVNKRQEEQSEIETEVTTKFGLKSSTNMNENLVNEREEKQSFASEFEAEVVTVASPESNTIEILPPDFQAEVATIPSVRRHE
ncbi:uncharacterized protein LOC107369218 [Tetranychus urticae]|uniref:uncharacterized protein LOC107369218 n=1 Tax=Tetranychus urticae TaxID=32264 RepID=UPI00077BFD2D|nr:uncharacterized protein LOC107369218 [Tetranychus urticae]